MVWLLILVVLNLSFFDISEEAMHHKTLPSAVVVGTVFCDTCFQDTFSTTSHFISGATVAVECRSGVSKPSFREEVKTNKTGEFKVHLPVSVSKHVKKIEECYVELIKSSEPYCAVAATAKSSSLQLKSRKQGIHTFSAGFFTFKPLKQPNLCNQKPHSTKFDDMKQILPPPLDFPGLPTPIRNPTVPNVPRIIDNLPPLPFLPGLPQLPPLPSLPPISVFPIFPPMKNHDENAPNPYRLHPNPLLHNPFLPSFSAPTPPSGPPAGAGAGTEAGEFAPSPPLPFALPPIPDLPEISTPPKETSP